MVNIVSKNFNLDLVLNYSFNLEFKLNFVKKVLLNVEVEILLFYRIPHG